MAAFSRRSLARYAVDELLNKKPAADISRHLAAALITSKKQKDAELLLDDIAEELEARGLYAQAIVTRATSLSTSLRSSLVSQVKKAAGVEEVVLNEQIDPEVIGGFRIETKRHTWDKTIARKLAEIKGGI